MRRRKKKSWTLRAVGCARSAELPNRSSFRCERVKITTLLARCQPRALASSASSVQRKSIYSSCRTRKKAPRTAKRPAWTVFARSSTRSTCVGSRRAEAGSWRKSFTRPSSVIRTVSGSTFSASLNLCSPSNSVVLQRQNRPTPQLQVCQVGSIGGVTHVVTFDQ